MWAFFQAVLAGARRSRGLSVRLSWRELWKDKQQCMCAFCESVPFWIGPSVTLCGGFSCGLSIRLSWWVPEETVRFL